MAGGKVRYEIYALSDPRTGEVRYIGKANDAQKRLKAHIRDSRRRDTPVYRWIRKLAREGVAPSVAVLATTSGDWQSLERREIAKARASGVRLLNVADGGDEPFCSVETRRENAKLVTKMRPQGVMRLYRFFEITARSAKKWAVMLNDPSIYEKHEARLGYWKVRIEEMRKRGTLEAFDAALIKYFNGEPMECLQ